MTLTFYMFRLCRGSRGISKLSSYFQPTLHAFGFLWTIYVSLIFSYPCGVFSAFLSASISARTSKLWWIRIQVHLRAWADPRPCRHGAAMLKHFASNAGRLLAFAWPGLADQAGHQRVYATGPSRGCPNVLLWTTDTPYPCWCAPICGTWYSVHFALGYQTVGREFRNLLYSN